MKKIYLQECEDGTLKSDPGTCSECSWIHYYIDPLARSCECGGEECIPESCPRFTDFCWNCSRNFLGQGYCCLDTGCTYCYDCVEVIHGESQTFWKCTNCLRKCSLAYDKYYVYAEEDGSLKRYHGPLCADCGFAIQDVNRNRYLKIYNPQENAPMTLDK